MIHTVRLAVAAIAFAAAAASAQAPDKIVFATDWLAQAEHGGFYQALADGTYRKYNLDVTIRMGGPQVNGLQLLAANQLDVAMADGLQVLSAAEQQVPLTAIAATFQKNPTVLISHRGRAKRIEGLPGLRVCVVIVIAEAGFGTPDLARRVSCSCDRSSELCERCVPLLAQCGSWYPNTRTAGFFALPVFSASALVTVRFTWADGNPATLPITLFIAYG